MLQYLDTVLLPVTNIIGTQQNICKPLSMNGTFFFKHQLNKMFAKFHLRKLWNCWEQASSVGVRDFYEPVVIY